MIHEKAKHARLIQISVRDQSGKEVKSVFTSSSSEALAYCFNRRLDIDHVRRCTGCLSDVWYVTNGQEDSGEKA